MKTDFGGFARERFGNELEDFIKDKNIQLQASTQLQVTEQFKQNVNHLVRDGDRIENYLRSLS